MSGANTPPSAAVSSENTDVDIDSIIERLLEGKFPLFSDVVIILSIL